MCLERIFCLAPIFYTTIATEAFHFVILAWIKKTCLGPLFGRALGSLGKTWLRGARNIPEWEHTIYQLYHPGNSRIWTRHFRSVCHVRAIIAKQKNNGPELFQNVTFETGLIAARYSYLENCSNYNISKLTTHINLRLYFKNFKLGFIIKITSNFYNLQNFKFFLPRFFCSKHFCGISACQSVLAVKV